MSLDRKESNLITHNVKVKGSLTQIGIYFISSHSDNIFICFIIRFTSALLLFGGFLLHSLPAALLFRPFSFYTRGQDQTQVKLSDLHKDDLPEVKVTGENGHKVTPDNGVTPGITLTSDSGSQHTLEGKSGTTYSKLEEAEESHVTAGCDEAVNQQELFPLVTSETDNQVAEHSDLNEPSDLNSSFMKPSKSVSALNDPKTRVGQLIKAASHSNVNLRPWKGSGTSLNLSALRKGRSLHTSTASLSIVEFQDLPPEVMQLQEKDVVNQFILLNWNVLSH